MSRVSAATRCAFSAYTGSLRSRCAYSLTVAPQPGGVHHDRLHALFDIRPPRVDIGADIVERLVVVAQMQTDRAATAGLGRDDRLDAERIEHACGGDVDVRHHRRLRATGEHQHLAFVLRNRPFERALARRHLVAQFLRQERAHVLTETHGRREQRAVGHKAGQHSAQQPLSERAGNLLFGDLAADFHQPPVLHARRAGGFAIAAGQTAIQVSLGAARHLARLRPSA